MSKIKILNEQSKPTTPTDARNQGWKLSKETAKSIGGCDDNGLEQVVINGRSYYKCKVGSQPNTVDNNTPTPSTPAPAPAQPSVE